MADLTKSKARSVRCIKRAKRPLAADAVVFKGGLAAVLAGYYVRGGTAGSITVGTFNQDGDNTGGADGAKSVEVDFHRERWVQLFANSGTAAVDLADREGACYAEDDQTASDLDTDPYLGIVYDVTSEGVWAEVGVVNVSP